MKKKLITDETYFNISEAARFIGVVPATIRNWEKQKLFITKRANNGYRIFSISDIDALQKIRALSEQGMHMNMIRSMTYPANLELTKQTKPIISKTLLGTKWKNYRLAHRHSIELVARKTGISPSYIHKIENAQTKNVSFDILQKLAAFYGENILSYYEQHLTTASPSVKKDTGDEVNIDLPGVSLQSITRCPNNQLTAMIYTVQPGFGRMDGHFHNGEELIYIISGDMEFILDNNASHILTAGDSLHFKSQIDHHWHNIGKTDAKMLWIHTLTNILDIMPKNSI